MDLEKFFIDVFSPEAGEVVVFLVDEPTESIPDNEAWRTRRAMAKRWRDAMENLGSKIGFEVKPLLLYPATGSHGADLPRMGRCGAEEVEIVPFLLDCTLAVAMTEFSATAPLAKLAEEKRDFRAASMPGVEPRMEETALAADYAKIAEKCQKAALLMEKAERLDVLFSTGHRCSFDLRYRKPEVDDGRLPRFKEGDRIINLPSGETFEVPYEGEKEGVPSWTSGQLPVVEEGELIVFCCCGNRIVAVEGSGPASQRWRKFFEEDPGRRNIAEVAFGLNDKAQVTGNVLEDEKAGFHWALGRSDHLGGVWGADRFTDPNKVVHQDIVYAAGNPVQVEEAALVYPDGSRSVVISNREYKL